MFICQIGLQTGQTEGRQECEKVTRGHGTISIQIRSTIVRGFEQARVVIHVRNGVKVARSVVKATIHDGRTAASVVHQCIWIEFQKRWIRTTT